ncbi:hypothetical protein Pint_17599 [Pistacia integerrima]|uniref:Uncharacterized protein n=1 Tax=Pistacia integerrima TaxID=434235 RepID=A0ACC0YUK2_9ROSI|nr:hypothetical protein Pint_17599 [Pistacia integerrima]
MMSGGRFPQHLLLVLVMVILFVVRQTVADSNIITCIEEEREALLALKQGLVDESGSLSSWGSEDVKKNCCSIPDAFGHFRSLRHLLLNENHLEGGIPESFGNMCRLLSLDLSRNNLGGKLSKSIRNLSGGCTEGTLETLNLSDNKFIGSAPDLSGFSSLKELQLGRNLLNGTLTNSIGLPYKLEVLVLRENSFEDFLEIFLSSYAIWQIFREAISVPPSPPTIFPLKLVICTGAMSILTM